jgi:adenylosuccinate synthase
MFGSGVQALILSHPYYNLAPFEININKSLLVSRKAHLILPTHRLLDAASLTIMENKDLSKRERRDSETVTPKKSKNA